MAKGVKLLISGEGKNRSMGLGRGLSGVLERMENRQIEADVAKGHLLQHVATGVAPSLHITPYRT